MVLLGGCKQTQGACPWVAGPTARHWQQVHWRRPNPQVAALQCALCRLLLLVFLCAPGGGWLWWVPVVGRLLQLVCVGGSWLVRILVRCAAVAGYPSLPWPRLQYTLWLAAAPLAAYPVVW
jgi:hypothetical protein